MPWIKPRCGRRSGAIASAGLRRTAIVDRAIPYDAVWDCVTCGACVEACPVIIEHVDKIVGLRRNLVLEESRFPASSRRPSRPWSATATPGASRPPARLDWTRGLPFEVPVAADVAAAGPGRVAELEVLYWVGCAAPSTIATGASHAPW